LKKLLKYLIAIVGIAFALYPILRNLGELGRLSFSVGHFVGAIAVLSLSYLLLPMIWLLVGRAFGFAMTPEEAVHSWFVSSVGRYIPGKVWQFVGRASLLPYPSSLVISAMFYEHLVLMVGASIFSFILPRFLPIQMGITIVLLLMLFAWRRVILLLARWFPRVEHYPRRMDYVLLAVGVSVMYWAISGVAAFLISRSIGWERGFREIAFIYSFSFVASYVIPLTPAGLGIREGIITAVMGYDLSSSVFALLTRVAIAITDLLMLILGLVVGIRGNSSEDSSEDPPSESRP